MTITAQAPSQELINLVGQIGGTWHGRTAMCLCPVHADKRPSLALRQGNNGILVTCFAGCKRTDVLRALSRVRVSGTYIHKNRPSTGHGNPKRIWNQGLAVRGTLAERYLTLRHLLPEPSDLRFHPRCPFQPMPRTLFLPALLVAVREGPRLTAIQRIFLDPKAATYRMKLMLGRPAGGAWQGSPAAKGILALAEGFETARAFTILNDIPCWATLGARRFDLIQLPSAINHLILANDNDHEGRRGATKAEERYARPGLSIERLPPPPGFKDWAGVLESDLISSLCPKPPASQSREPTSQNHGSALYNGK